MVIFHVIDSVCFQFLNTLSLNIAIISYHHFITLVVKKMFDEVDKDKDGKINKAEIKYLISSMNQTGGEDLLDGVFKFLDKDGN